jgi:sarcosine oxidase subunit gamma
MSNSLNLSLESPLHAFGLAARAAVPEPRHSLVLAEISHLGYVALRGKADDTGFMHAVSGVLGQALPTQPRTLLSTSSGAVLWVSPDEWLLVCKRSARDALLSALTTALQDQFAQVVDNSGGFTTLRVSGPDHLMLLRQLGPYNFESLAVGYSASTVMSKTSVTVVRTDETSVLLVFRRSFSDYFWNLLERTARPYSLCIAPVAHCADPVFAPLFETH